MSCCEVQAVKKNEFVSYIFDERTIQSRGIGAYILIIE
jgi:hypothetical protein